MQRRRALRERQPRGAFAKDSARSALQKNAIFARLNRVSQVFIMGRREAAVLVYFLLKDEPRKEPRKEHEWNKRTTGESPDRPSHAKPSPTPSSKVLRREQKGNVLLFLHRPLGSRRVSVSRLPASVLPF